MIHNFLVSFFGLMSSWIMNVRILYWLVEFLNTDWCPFIRNCSVWKNLIKYILIKSRKVLFLLEFLFYTVTISENWQSESTLNWELLFVLVVITYMIIALLRMIRMINDEDLRRTTSHETNGKADLRKRSGIASEYLFFPSHCSVVKIK